ncbi:MAG: isoprenylcysteine carboxylmethyltransferase family protein [Candidatus Planktophila sp.]|nr:isoprenylcysteine carboxylmethyltransferase family protein [Candidatus Planktophila sp.]
MMGYIAFTVLIFLVAVERVFELIISKRNLRWSFDQGGIEFGRSHYKYMVALHVFLLGGSPVEVWLFRPTFLPFVSWAMLILALASQALRWWCIFSLGKRWNTLVVIIPGKSLIEAGPYRWFKHPNYVAVVIEGFALPMVGFAWRTALAFSLLNVFVLYVRIRTENAALATLPRNS